MVAGDLAILPVIIPAVAAPLALLAMRRQRGVGVAISLIACLAMLAAAITLFIATQDDVIRVYAIGNWQAPFGIVLVVDRLSAIMLVLTATLATLVAGHSVITGLDTRGWHFHPLFQFQLLGLNGAFLTGDLFNLFVFFEVLLIASYGLMLHGQGAARYKAGVQYVVVNVVGSTLFLVALGLLYGLTGTLNMADMAVRVAQLPQGDQGLVRIAGLLLIAVFALKAALAPLHLWLPWTYSATSPAVAALFAIMTKLGVYSIIRTVPLIFGADAGAAAWVPEPWLIPAALVSACLGFAGVFAARGLREQAAFAIVGSTATLLLAVGTWTPDSMTAALYYLVHATLAGATLFLVADLVVRRRGSHGDTPTQSPRFQDQDAIGAMFLLTAIAAVGLPPLSGFIGKLLILRMTFDSEWMPWIWAVILGTTFIGIVGFARTGSAIFWKGGHENDPSGTARAMPRSDLIAPALALALLAAMVAGAGWITAQTAATAAQIFNPQAYIGAVLGGPTP